MSKEAMTLALELFEQFGRDSRLKYEHQAIYKTIVALKEALAKQEQGDPVAWLYKDTGVIVRDFRINPKNVICLPLYTTPQPAQKPLTDEQIDATPWIGGLNRDSVRRFARAIEAAHGIKE